MSKRVVGIPVLAGAALAVLAGISFSLACILSARGDLGGSERESMLARLLGESRQAIGANLNIEADRYFHRGVPHQHELAFVDQFQRLKDQVQPRDHDHLSGTEMFEMMPWLRLATRLDPHNVDAYLGAAFWAAEQKGYEQQALEILKEARKNNPNDYRIPLQRGMILLHYGVIADATRSFDTGLRLWPRGEGVTEEQKRNDLASLLNYRGFLYEFEGRNDMALACYHGSLKLRPDSAGLAEIIREIEYDGRSRDEIERTLQVFLRSSGAPSGRHFHVDEYGQAYGHVHGREEHEYPFEWMGVYRLAPGSYEYILQAGPDAVMDVVVVSVSRPDAAAVEGAKDSAAGLFGSAEPKAVPVGGVIEPGQSVYRLRLAKSDFHCTIRIPKEGAYAVFTEHVPEEFNAKLRSEAGSIEPVFGKIVGGHHHHAHTHEGLDHGHAHGAADHEHDHH